VKRLLVIVALLLAGCAVTGPVPLPADPGALVAGYEVIGSLRPPLDLALSRPALLVYADGLVVRDAERRLTLPPAELADLVRTLRADLHGLSGDRSTPQARRIVDGGATRLMVRDADGRARRIGAVQLYVGDDFGYPLPLVRAVRALGALYERIGREGTPYTSNRVRLAASTAYGEPKTPPVAWPDGIAVPEAGGYDAHRDLDGVAAHAVVAAFPEQRGPQVYRLGDGRLVTVGWRWIAPGEDLVAQR
jgi:hypothetical protein